MFGHSVRMTIWPFLRVVLRLPLARQSNRSLSPLSFAQSGVATNCDGSSTVNPSTALQLIDNQSW